MKQALFYYSLLMTFTLCISMPQAAEAIGKDELTLKECIDIALSNNLELLKKEYQRQAAKFA